MVKRSATILALLFALTLGAYAKGGPWWWIYDNGNWGSNNGNGGWNNGNRDWTNDDGGSGTGNNVPEPGSLLVFGSGLLLGLKALRRKV